MDPHTLPIFFDNNNDFTKSSSKRITKPLVVNGQPLQIPSSFSPPTEHELNEFNVVNNISKPQQSSEYTKSPTTEPVPDPGQVPALAPSKEDDLLFEKLPTTPDVSINEEPSGISEAMANSGQYRARMQMLTVFIPCVDPRDGAGLQHKLQVAVPESVRAPEVIVAALQVMQSEQLSKPKDQRLTYSSNPHLYRLRVAEDNNGTVDKDVPALDSSTKIVRGLERLTMVYIEENRDRGSVYMQPNRKTLDDIPFVINCPTGKNRVVKRRVILPPDVLYKDLLVLVCERLNRDPKKHQIKMIIGGSYRTSLADGSAPSDKTLSTLYHTYAVLEFALENLGMDIFDEPPEDEEVEDTRGDDVRGMLYTEYDACKYQEFHVIKINKWGAKQPRVLGIDREKIYNMMPTRERTLVGSVRQTQHPDRRIDDIEAFRQPDPARPCFFEIEYKKSTQIPMDRIECNSRRDAQEIYMKIQVLLVLHQQGLKKFRTPGDLRRGLPSRLMAGVGSLIHTLADMPDDVVKKLRAEMVPAESGY